jgi:hypothetical protein
MLLNYNEKRDRDLLELEIENLFEIDPIDAKRVELNVIEYLRSIEHYSY